MEGSYCLPSAMIRDDCLDGWQEIGTGGFGKIYRAKHKKWGINVAVKLLRCNDRSTLMKEASLMFQGGNPNVLRIFGFYEGHLGSPQNWSQLGLVMEFMERGSLADLLETLGGPPAWPLTFRITHQIGLGMNFLHQLAPPLLHLDLKPSNVLLDDSLNAKLTDFGLSRVAQSLSKGVRENNEVEGGTLSYMPPEALMPGKYRPDQAFDIYSYGVLLWSIITGKEPYGHFPTSLVQFRICQGDRPDLTLIDSKADQLDVVVELMKRCWDKEPNQRPSFRDCVNVTEELYEQHKRGVSEAVSDVLRQLDGEICSSLKSLHITSEPQNEACPQVSPGVTAFPKQKTSTNHNRKTVKKESPNQIAGREKTPQRQTSTPGDMRIKMANVYGVQIGNGNYMNIVRMPRQRHKTAPSSVNRTLNHPENSPNPS